MENISHEDLELNTEGLPGVNEELLGPEKQESEVNKDSEAPSNVSKINEANVKSMRENLAKIKKERDEYESKLAEIEKNNREEREELDKERYESLSEQERLSEDVQKIKERQQQDDSVRKQHEIRKQQDATQSEIEERLRVKYPDIDEILSDANIKKLRGMDSDFDKMLATPAQTPQELYNRAISGRFLALEYGIHKPKSKEDINIDKPIPTSAIGASSSLTQFTNLSNASPYERKEYFRRVSRERAMKSS